MRFYLDENLPQTVAVISRRLGLDVTSAQELGRRGLSDDEQLALATSEDRCIVTLDYDDYPVIAREAPLRGLEHAGVLMVSPSLIARGYVAIAEAMRRFDQEHPQGFGPYGSDWLT